MLLSDVLPTFEHMGAKVVDERPYEITPADRDAGVDLRLRPAGATPANTERVRDLLHDAFLGVWRGDSRTTG